MANKTLTHREGNSILKASFNRRKITAVEDDIICTEKIIAERKTFFLDLKQNARGKVVRITEKVSSNRDRIMVPAEILDDFIAALQDIRETLKQQGELVPLCLFLLFNAGGAVVVPLFPGIRMGGYPAGKKLLCLN